MSGYAGILKLIWLGIRKGLKRCVKGSGYILGNLGGLGKKVKLSPLNKTALRLIHNPPGSLWGENARHGVTTSQPQREPDKGDCG